MKEKLPLCPNCRADKILVSYEKESEPNYYAVFFALFYLLWLAVRLSIGLLVLIFYDPWRAIWQKRRGKYHVFVSKRWFRGSKKSYYCENCKTHFKG